MNEHLDTLLRLLAATACGGVLGWERQARDKSAGLRTNILVAVGAATAAVTAMHLREQILAPGEAVVSADPIRIVSGVIGGLGFLGAGAILQSRGEVHGMTTAATIWVVGGIGVACGLGDYATAGIATGVAFLALWLLGRLQHSSLAPSSLQKDGDSAERATD
ncbi:putative Mg(2+) transport ATPase [Pseudobythopirellula maris]|uniref:Putative Mg(2+) transport ATPase n=1 Tax=Pseudobythopirellula maris TaxID=2527991 RepID=A0A5C5ZNG9_9BACT|nr:MgtC/SapB family protein [Pseudobythopirellula maris]TWT88457.1 putative Mg(2+) transport ATPase [Pseudobythopirellula maris]